MSKLRNISLFRIISGVILASFLIFAGCSTSQTYTAQEKQTLARTLYQEKCTINTEPSGCRIYVQNEYIGISPVEVLLNGGEAELSRIGYYDYVHDIGWDVGPARRTSATRWSGPRWTPKTEGTWTIKAFKDGRESATYVVKCGDEVFAQAFVNVNSQNSPEVVISSRNLLLELKPISITKDYRKRMPEESSRRKGSVDIAAKAEYEAALAAYNQALKELNEARTLAAAPKKYPHPALGALMAIAEPHAVAEAERKVEIARQHLDRARARINHSEW